MSKIPKAAVLYVLGNGTNYTCRDCTFLRANECALMRLDDCLVSPLRGGCGMFVQGDGGEEFYPSLTKEQLGYAENENGFTCGRCEEFVPDYLDCEKVDKDSPGDTPGEIIAATCCNRWERDPRRGNMDDDTLKRTLAPDLEKAMRRRGMVKG